MGYGLVDAYAALNSESDIVYFTNQNVTSDVTVRGNKVETQNITVSNGAKLTIIAPQGVKSLQPLRINSGCKFELRAQ